MKVAIIGAGVSGLTCARLLNNSFSVTVFEQEAEVGGLIRCKWVDGSLFHICGGHVFNTKNQAVNKWFWGIFDKNNEFISADRHSAVCMDDGRFVDYPIENHVYQLDTATQKDIFREVSEMMKSGRKEPTNFEEFLVGRFGKTLYELYFKPYNQKIWRQNLSDIPLSWLEGKLPMPTPADILIANQKRIEEKSFVHSSFYYPRINGSQFIADRLAHGLDVRHNAKVDAIRVYNDHMVLHTLGGVDESFDYCVFCGNIKTLPSMLRGADIGDELCEKIEKLKSHGTTSVFCKTDSIPYSWFYQPSPRHDSHRFICTGNFSPSNNAKGSMTCTVEFTDEIDIQEIKRQLKLMPFNPRYVTHNYSQYTYPVQAADTRSVIQEIKARLSRFNITLVGRFAEWEYFNMDAAIASAMNAINGIIK